MENEKVQLLRSWLGMCQTSVTSSGQNVERQQIFQLNILLIYWQGCGVGVAVPQSPDFDPESVIWRRLRLQAQSISSGLLCNFVAVYLTFVQFILQLKLCLYTTVHLLLEKFKISLKSSLNTQSLCHTLSPRVGGGVWFWARSRGPSFLVPESESGVLNFLTV